MSSSPSPTAKLYALDLVTNYGEHTEFRGAKLYRLTWRTTGIAFEALWTWTGATWWSTTTTDSYPMRPEAIIGVGGKALFRAYDTQGDYSLYALDLTTGARAGGRARRAPTP